MRLLLVFALVFASHAVHAQHAQPYKGQQARDIKALSDQEVGQYLAGAGMGFARAAELNGYPGPMHVLELAEPLQLSPTQRSAIEELMKVHKSEARAIGAELVRAESELEALFRSADASAEAISAAVAKAARLQGEYRLSHLETHRRARAMLTPNQLMQYAALRGYGEPHRH